MNINRKHIGFLVFGFSLGWIVMTVLLFNNARVQLEIREIINEKIVLDSLTFSQDNLISKMKEINIKYPHIVLAQSQLETGNFTSKIFKHNHNLFGMKEAKARVKLALGTKSNHAYYNTWVESLYDYAFMYCRYLGKINNEEEYYNYLGRVYAEDPLYVNKLKKLAEKNKELF